MKTYAITRKEDGKRVATILDSSLSLREAQIELLSLFNRRFDTNFSNRGLATQYDPGYGHACPTFFGWYKFFVYDVYRFKITEEEKEEDED